VFLGLIAAGNPGPDVAAVAAALAAFALGVFASTRMVGASGSPGRWPARVTGALALVVLAQAAFAAGWIAVSGEPSDSMADVLAGTLALAMGMQSGAVLSLGVKGVFTTAATATLIYLSREPAVESAPGERARYAGVLLALLAGAVSGGLLLEHARTYAALLPLAVTSLVVAIASGATSARRRQRNTSIAPGDLDAPGRSLPPSYRPSQPLDMGARPKTHTSKEPLTSCLPSPRRSRSS